MLRAKLEMPRRPTTHLQSDLEFDQRVNLLLMATMFTYPATISIVNVTDQLVQITPVVMLQRELVTKRCPVVDLIVPFVVKRFNIDVRIDCVSLRFRMG